MRAQGRRPGVIARGVAVLATLGAAVVAAHPAGAQAPPDTTPAATTTTTTTAPAETPPTTAGSTRAPKAPVGDGRVASPDEVVSMAATSVRAVGHQPYDDTVAAAASFGATVRGQGCGLSDAKLAAIMLSIPFTEVGPLDSATVAPSPMTLSRFDGSAILFAFGDPQTSLRRAFWSPGIGLWQFDHPWPNTAAERIDTSTAAQLAAEVISGRYCGWTSATGLTRFAYAVRPWHGCDDPRGDGERCREIFLNHYRDNSPASLTDDTLVNFTLVDSVGRLGGAVRRSCQMVGSAAVVPCLFVDPALAQGNLAWTTDAFSSNPLSAPFYVLRDGSLERRFWLSEDSGYSTDVDASATVGSDPRTTLQWRSGPALCDLTTKKGACDLRPPSWKDWAITQVSGTYQPFTGDFDGDGRSDIFWYAPGSAADSLWLARGGTTFQRISRPVSGTYQPFTGDFDGDGRSDIFWYAPGSAADSVWTSKGDGTFTATARSVPGTYKPLVADFDGDGRTDVYWYAPGSPAGSPDELWRWTAGGTVTRTAMPLSGTYTPRVGDFDGDGRSDVFLYGVGTIGDHLWYGTAAGGFTKTNLSVGGDYQPLVGDFDGDAADDMFWYAPGSAADSIWYGSAARTFARVARPVSGLYQPVVGDLNGDGRSDIVWYAPGVTADTVWRGTATRSFVTDTVVINGTYKPLVGDIDGVAGDDVYWYRAGSGEDGIWFG